MDLNELLDACRSAAKLTSDNQLAGKLGVSRQAVSNWRHGNNAPDALACAAIAKMTGFKLATVIGIAGEARAISPSEKAIWRRLATAAAIILAVSSLAMPIMLNLKNVLACLLRRGPVLPICAKG